MISIAFTDVQWGVDKLPDGVQINLKDAESNVWGFVPFDKDTVPLLAGELINSMDPQSRDEFIKGLTLLDAPDVENKNGGGDE